MKTSHNIVAELRLAGIGICIIQTSKVQANKSNTHNQAQDRFCSAQASGLYRLHTGLKRTNKENLLEGSHFKLDICVGLECVIKSAMISHLA